MSAGQVKDRTSESEREQVRFRLKFWQQVPSLLPIPIVLSAEWIVQLLGPPSSAANGLTATERHQIFEVSFVTDAIVVLFFLVMVLLGRSFGITLTPTEARVRNLRRRVIRWSDVRAVTTERVLGTHFVVLHEANRRTRLRAPITGFLVWDRRFEEKYHTIGQWWLDHRDEIRA